MSSKFSVFHYKKEREKKLVFLKRTLLPFSQELDKSFIS
jgi:hypothetical protein